MLEIAPGKVARVIIKAREYDSVPSGSDSRSERPNWGVWSRAVRRPFHSMYGSLPRPPSWSRNSISR